MRKVFLDLGCWNGASTELFFKDRLPIKSEGFVVYGFDPIKKYLGKMGDLSRKHPFIFINKAVWIYDGEVEFGEYPNDESSSLKKEKIGFERATVSKVPCLDFSMWIKQFRGDFVVVKMNIEGAELEILEKMIEDDTLGIISELWIEKHTDKISQDYNIRMDALHAQHPEWKRYKRHYYA